MGERIRRPAVSGRFYPDDPDTLVRTVDALLARAGGQVPAPARAGVVPHAAYDYSGPTAACLFARATLPAVHVIVAPNHSGRRAAPGGASLWAHGAFRTPLGDVPVADDVATDLLRRCRLVADDPAAHSDEHAVEVLLPLLVRVRPDARIVPLVLAWTDHQRCEALAHALAGLVADWPEPLFLLASSDLNHYEAAEVTERKDALALEQVCALDGPGLLAACRRHRISMCGRAGTAAVVSAARRLGCRRGDVLDHCHSGWVGGDQSAVVGYAAVAIA